MDQIVEIGCYRAVTKDCEFKSDFSLVLKGLCFHSNPYPG